MFVFRDDDLDQGGLKNSGATEIRWGLKKGGRRIEEGLCCCCYCLPLPVGWGSNYEILQIFQVPHKLCHYTYQDCNDFDVSFGGRGRRELPTHLKHIAMMEGNKLSELNQIMHT